MNDEFVTDEEAKRRRKAYVDELLHDLEQRGITRPQIRGKTVMELIAWRQQLVEAEMQSTVSPEVCPHGKRECRWCG